MNDLPTYLLEIQQETRLRFAVRGLPDPRAGELWREAIAGVDDIDSRNRLNQAHAYSTAIAYDHVGLSSEAYAAHPLRVGALCLMVGDKPDIEAGVIGLLHNVFEVTKIAPQEIAEEFGASVVDSMTALTVDRARQWEDEYKQRYYEKIWQAGTSTCLVKAVDKLDNLFLIGCNPDPRTRSRYLREIERWVLPLAERVDKPLYRYMSQLTAEKLAEEQNRDNVD